MLFGAQKNQRIPHFTGEKSPCLRTIYPTGNPMWPFKTPERNGVYLRQSTMAVESPPFIIYRWVFPIKTPFIVGFKLPRLITRVTRGYSWTKNQQNGAAIFSELEPCNRPPARRHGHPPVPGRCLHHRWHCLGFIFGWAKLTSLTFLDDIWIYIYIIYISDILQWWNHPIIPLNSKIWGQPVSFGSLVFPSPPLRSWHPDAASSKQDRSPKFVESREHLASIIPQVPRVQQVARCQLGKSPHQRVNGGFWWKNHLFFGWFKLVCSNKDGIHWIQVPIFAMYPLFLAASDCMIVGYNILYL